MPFKAKRQTKRKADIENKEIKNSDMVDITPTMTLTSKPAAKRACIIAGKSLKNLVVSSLLSIYLSGSALTIAANENKYKINTQYFLLQLNFIVQGILKDEVGLIFYALEFSFIKRLRTKAVKVRCFSAFLWEVEYVNRIMQARVEYYATK